MDIKCECGQVVAKGNIKTKDKKKGGQRKIFEIEGNHVNGEIRRNESNDPEKWTGICSKCQKENAKNDKVANKIAEEL